MWSIITERCFSMFSSDSGDRKQTRRPESSGRFLLKQEIRNHSGRSKSTFVRWLFHFLIWIVVENVIEIILTVERHSSISNANSDFLRCSLFFHFFHLIVYLKRDSAHWWTFKTINALKNVNMPDLSFELVSIRSPSHTTFKNMTFIYIAK